MLWSAGPALMWIKKPLENPRSGSQRLDAWSYDENRNLAH